MTGDVMNWGPLTMNTENLLREQSLRRKVASFFARPYWKRSWIIQEIAAATDLQIWCGNSVLSWEKFESLLRTWLDFRQQTDPIYAAQLRVVEVPVRPEAEIYSSLHIRASQMLGRSFTLLQLLQMFCRSNAHNPLDKVYALLGLAWDRSHYITEPEYQIPDQKRLCLRMSRTAILRKRSLDSIFLAGKWSADRNLPSWCPYYTQFMGNDLTTGLILYLANQQKQYRVGEEGYKWQTTRHSLASSLTFDVHQSVLITEAYEVDTIRSLGKLGDEEGDRRYDDVAPASKDILLVDSLSCNGSIR